MQLIKLERQKGIGTKLQINGSVAVWVVTILVLGVNGILVKIYEGNSLLGAISYFTKVILITATVFLGLLAIISILWKIRKQIKVVLEI